MANKKDQRNTRKGGHYATGEVSVTTVLGMMDKPALTGWLRKKTFEATMEGAKTSVEAYRAVNKISQKAMDIGTQVHKYVEDFRTGKEPEMAGENIKYYQAFHNWVAKYNPVFVGREVTVTSPSKGYKGTVDLLATVNGKDCLIDLKTGKGIYETVELQTSAYKQAYEEQGRGKIAETWCLLLEKGGDGLPTGNYKFEQQNYVPEIFNSLVDLYYWKRDKAKAKRESKIL